MKYASSYIQSALKIIKNYAGENPFHLYLKRYFASNKKYGSRDRKQITSLCYNYFRLGHAAKSISVEEQILLATFLCEIKPSKLLENLKPEWNDQIEKTLEEKLSLVKETFLIKNIFPFQDELSDGINADKFALSFLFQPKLFLRIRHGNKNKVIGKLAGAGLSYKLYNEDCVELSNAVKIDSVIELNKEAVVQDFNSQRTAEFIEQKTTNQKPETSVWDCCAASGGKSIMAYDFISNIELTVSDKRESILQNLHKRFAAANVKNYKSFVADLTTHNMQMTKKYDLIICDAPCTGSGTWARTPEQLCYFKKESVKKYSILQKKIIENIAPYLKSGGQLLYITCSVFKKENEDVVDFIKEKFNLRLEKMEILKGYQMQADTMFAALFTAP